MATIVTGVFGSAAAGQAAAEELRRSGFGESAVRVVSGVDEAAAEQALKATGLSHGDVSAIAGVVRGGGAAVSAQAEFGEGRRATAALEAHAPQEIKTSSGDFATPARSGTRAAAPATGRIADDPAPLSRALNVPVLSESDRPSADLMSDNPAPFSRMLGLPLLTRGGAPNVKLSHDPAPLSHAVGWRLLSDKAAPLSAALGLPLLSRDKHAK